MFMNAYNAGIIIGVVVVVSLMVLSWAWGTSRGTSLLEGWAQSHGLQILSQEECLFFKGPFFWTSSKGQRVYRVSVRDREGFDRQGYVRCGGFWLGMMSDNVEVRWDD